MASLARAARVSLLAVLSLAVVVAATGWLYLLQGHTPGLGVQVADAVPLDELPHHAGVPLVVFVAVWGGAALLLGLLTRGSWRPSRGSSTSAARARTRARSCAAPS